MACLETPGEVIKATYGGALVAVKRMLRGRIDGENMKEFREEVVLLKGLRHPNIVQFVVRGWDVSAVPK